MQRTPDLAPWPAVVLLAALAVAGTLIAVTGQQFTVMAALLASGILFVIWRQPHYGILIFLLTFLLTYPEYLKGYGLFTINNVIGALFCLLLLFHLRQERNLWAFRDIRIRIMLAIALVFLMATWLARDPPPSLMNLDRTSMELWDFFTQFAFVVFMIHFIRTRQHLQLIFGLLLIVIIASALSALFIPATDYRASAAFGIKAASNSNRLGFYCLLGIAMLWYLRQEVSSPVLKSAMLGVAAMLLLVIFLTASRSALINTLFFAAILAVEAGFRLRRFLAMALVIGACGFLVLNLVPEQHLNRMTTLESADSSKPSEAYKSAENRLQVAKVALEVYADSNPLFGVGPGNFRWIRQLEYDLKRLSFHNGYLWALLSGGIAALSLYLFLYWTCWRDLRRLEKLPPSAAKPPRWMIKFTQTALLLFLMFSLFAEAWLEIIPFFIIGVTIVLMRLYQDNGGVLLPA